MVEKCMNMLFPGCVGYLISRHTHPLILLTYVDLLYSYFTYQEVLCVREEGRGVDREGRRERKGGGEWNDFFKGSFLGFKKYLCRYKVCQMPNASQWSQIITLYTYRG